MNYNTESDRERESEREIEREWKQIAREDKKGHTIHYHHHHHDSNVYVRVSVEKGGGNKNREWNGAHTNELGNGGGWWWEMGNPMKNVPILKQCVCVYVWLVWCTLCRCAYLIFCYRIACVCAFCLQKRQTYTIVTGCKALRASFCFTVCLMTAKESGWILFNLT